MTLDERYAVLGGTVSYRQLAAGAGPWWADDAHLCTEAARARLAAWLARGGLTQPEPAIGESLQYTGDHALVPVLVQALAAVPQPVRDWIATSVLFVGTGWNSLGWMSGPLDARRVTIAICGASRAAPQIWQTALHECAHAWLEPAPARQNSVRASVIAAAAVHEPWYPALQRDVAQREYRAERLAHVWEAHSPFESPTQTRTLA